MALFFFLLGLEMKRELLVGELRSSRKAISVMFAAAGGMLVPAALFLLVADPSVSAGWAIPVATDTAFALMILVLLADRIPAAARAFLVGLAIIDDLGAISVIALFYTSSLDTAYLAPAVACIALLIGFNICGIRNALPYAIVGIVLWGLFAQLGLHGTMTGVVVAFTAPVRPQLPRHHFIKNVLHRTGRFAANHTTGTESIFQQPEQQEIAEEVARDAKRATAPLVRWESSLEKPVSFVIVPLFAFMNAGVPLPWGSFGEASWSTLSSAILIGLLVGKPLGILIGLFIGRVLGLADLPAGMNWRHALGIGVLGGIGFTMSLFIATLSFGGGSAMLDLAKISVIGSSFLAGIIGYCWLRYCCGKPPGER